MIFVFLSSFGNEISNITFYLILILPLRIIQKFSETLRNIFRLVFYKDF